MKAYYCISNDGKVTGKPFKVKVFDGVTHYCLTHAATKQQAEEACKSDGKGFPIRFTLFDNRPQS